jgi:uncharacterized protein
MPRASEPFAVETNGTKIESKTMGAIGGRRRARRAADAARRSDAIEGVERRADGRIVLKARVRAAPFEGQANEALCRLLAHELGLAPRQVEISAGEGARIKRLRIAGDPRMLDAALDRLTKVSAQGGT